jgi:hypothetical protein
MAREKQRKLWPVSQWLGCLLNIRDKPWTIDHSPFWKPFFDNGIKHGLWKTGRQIFKSTNLAAKILAIMTRIKNFRWLYVTQDNNALGTFSEARLYTLLNSSSLFKNYYMHGDEVIKNTWKLKINNGSLCELRNCAGNGRNLRGPSADGLCVDELQNIESMDLITLAQETMAASPLGPDGRALYRYENYTGTPLTLDNIMEKQWRTSTQAEWLIPCSKCARTLSVVGSKPKDTLSIHYNNIGIRNLTPDGLICDRCGAFIVPREGFWYKFKPKAMLQGFRIPQPLSPLADFFDIYYNKLKKYSLPRFMNEVLGLSWESALKYLTEQEVRGLCDKNLRMLKGLTKRYVGRPKFFGIDWGMNTEDGGRTAFAIFAEIRPGEMELIYGRVYPHTMNHLKIVAHIVKTLQRFEVTYGVGDMGVAGDRNLKIAELIGTEKMMGCYYTGSARQYTKSTGEVQNVITVGKVGALVTFRTDALHRKAIKLIRWEDFEQPFGEHFLAEGQEVDHYGNLRFLKTGENDDFLHACVYANMARRMFYGQPPIDNIEDAEEMAAMSGSKFDHDYDDAVDWWD